ncbi:MAG: DUF924 family protein [Hyphomicrobiales bacterium]|nr:DUF924 family protein [Hyphomicrobiales bacterium]
MTEIAADDVLNFWFSSTARDNWFAKNPRFDEEIRARFANAHSAARLGRFAHWRASAEGALALVLIFDQFPRNMYRGAADAYATDDLALEIARDTITAGQDAQLSEEERGFLYMPYMHSEDLAVQDVGLRLYGELGHKERLDYMWRHHAVISQFGRFPHRNAVLGRQSTPEELAFLATPGSSF